jgi:cytochrome c-type biogenesis protein CcmH/NrfG
MRSRRTNRPIDLHHSPWRNRALVPILAYGFLTAALSLAPLVFGQTKQIAPDFEVLAKQAAKARDADKLNEAAVLYKAALSRQPKWAEGWWSLGMLEYDQSNYEAAANALRKFLALSPSNGTADVMLGLSEFELGEDADALQHLEEGKNLGVANDPQLPCRSRINTYPRVANSTN